MAGQWLPADHSRGDANTIGGYMQVHARPAAFEGSDGFSYSVAIEADATGEGEHPFGAYFLFLRWRRIGAQGVEGHMESGYLAFGATPDAARESLGRWSLAEVRAELEARLLEEHRRNDGDSDPGRPVAGRRWWDVMRGEDGA
jgi:hypothetical protein